MITLANLHQAMPQEVYEHVSKHLLKQNKPSIDSGGKCAYHGLNGLRCAAGCLITTQEYKQLNIEGLVWTDLAGRGIIPTEHRTLISQLQKIHDDTLPSGWKAALINLGMKHSFNMECIK